MYTNNTQPNKWIYRSTVLVLAISLLGGCSQSQQLGMEDNPQKILEMKLNNPEVVLTSNQSITLVDHCAELGEQNAIAATHRVTCLTLGNTGVGKSTFLNGVMGCKLKSVRPRELGLGGMKKVVIVDPESTQAEVTPIGHEGTSKTFLPRIVQDHNNPTSAYCDCPGFSDNRGEEINIANAINVRRVLQQASDVKAVFLTEYFDLIGSRGRNIEAMEKMCEQMFGNVDNLRRNQNSVLLGVTKAPLYEDDEPVTQEMVRSLLTRNNRPISQILANHLFLFDPLDRATDNPDFWSLERCRTEIAQLEPIPQHAATSLFQTALTDSDQTKLKRIMRDQAAQLARTLENDDYEKAGKYWQSLARLQVIESDEVERMVGEHALVKIQHHVTGCIGAFKSYAIQYQFDQAERQLALLKMLASHFPNADLKVNLAALEALLTQCKEKKAEEQSNTDKKLAAAKQKAVQEVREEMEQKLAQLETQLRTAEQKNRRRQQRQQPDVSINVTLQVPLD